MGRPKVYRYQVRFSREQFERLKTTAKARGFGHLSDFVRFMTLDHDLWLARKVTEIHDLLMSQHYDEPPGPKKKRKRGLAHPDAVWSK